MIGQKDLVSKIVGQVSRGKFPRFTILIGEKGSGKRLLAKEIGSLLNCVSVYADTSVEEIRLIIEESYKLIDNMVYIIENCDSMSIAAANALLKVTEEPPKNAYFILTCENIENLLPTLKSRGVTYMLEPYSYEDKCDYLDTLNKRPTDEDVEFILEVATNIGEVKSMLDIDIGSFRDYVNLVIDNIAEVSGSNAFKIGDKIAFKEDNKKYDLTLFWKAFSAICVDRMCKEDDALKYARAIAITGDSLQQLHIKGINKQMLFDNWLLSIREEWL